MESTLRPDLFLGAQAVSYETAIQELRSGRKETHWVWFVFPQMRGLGNSDTSQLFGLSVDEAREYWAHPVLRERLVTALVNLGYDEPVENVLGRDAIKVRSCFTLFELATGHALFTHMLERCFGGERCLLTLQAT